MHTPARWYTMNLRPRLMLLLRQASRYLGSRESHIASIYADQGRTAIAAMKLLEMAILPNRGPARITLISSNHLPRSPKRNTARSDPHLLPTSRVIAAEGSEAECELSSVHSLPQYPCLIAPSDIGFEDTRYQGGENDQDSAAQSSGNSPDSRSLHPLPSPRSAWRQFRLQFAV